MGLWSPRRPAGALALTAVGFLTLAGGNSAHAACYGPKQQLPAQTVTQFTTNPAQLLTQYPDGGARMISAIRDLVASNPTTLPVILDLVANANAAQIDAIATGLAQGALVCVRTDQAFATEIQQMVAALNNQPLTLAFTAVLGDQAIGAAGGGGGGGGEGGGGGPTTSVSGIGTLAAPPSFFATTSATNTGTNYFTSSFSVGSTPGTTTTTTTSVSPSRP